MYIYTDDATRLDPRPPCSRSRAIHARPGVTYARGRALLSGSTIGFAFVREFVNCFV